MSSSFRQEVSLAKNLLLILAIVYGGQLVMGSLPTEFVIWSGYAFGSFGVSIVFGTILFERRTRLRIWVSFLPSRLSPRWIEYRLENLGANAEAV